MRLFIVHELRLSLRTVPSQTRPGAPCHLTAAPGVHNAGALPSDRPWPGRPWRQVGTTTRAVGTPVNRRPAACRAVDDAMILAKTRTWSTTSEYRDQIGLLSMVYFMCRYSSDIVHVFASVSFECRLWMRLCWGFVLEGFGIRHTGTNPHNVLWEGVQRWEQFCAVVTSEREARSEFLLWFKGEIWVCADRPNPTRPNDAFEKLISLELDDRITSGLLCSMSPFNKFRIWPTPLPAGACHGTRHVPSERVSKTSYPR